MKIYTRTGDAGDTGLFGGGRVPKTHPRVEAYGDVDELNATIGLARAIELMPRVDEVLVPLQRDLFAIGALLATPDRDKMKKQLEKANIDERRITELEHARRSSSRAERRRRLHCTSRARCAVAPNAVSLRSRTMESRRSWSCTSTGCPICSSRSRA
jgi:cob(I)alamin adenosyltransferase